MLGAMTRRSLATAIAVPLLVGLWVAAALVPVPYVSYRPGSTTDMLAETQGQERIQVSGHQAYYDDDGGSLRMTTVSVTPPERDVSIFEALGAWLSDEQAVEPYLAVYDRGETDQQSDTEGEVDMVSSQDAAIAVALTELGYDLETHLAILAVEPDMPADGKLEQGDEVLSVNGVEVTDAGQVGEAVRQGGDVDLVVRRDGKRREVTISPKDTADGPRIGVQVGPTYDFPFDVTVLIDPRIGGPSAGLMFSLAIYDTLTPGPLTGGHDIAGTGEIRADGTVVPIGGIAQKVVGARNAGTDLFLVPSPNCEEALGAPRGDMRLVRVKTFEDALSSVKAWVDDPKADLPSCEEE
jgi:PDZ domain-containing protein